MLKWLSTFYSRNFVGIQEGKDYFSVSHLLVKNKKIKSSATKIFKKVDDTDVLPVVLRKYVESLEAKTPFCYISYMLQSGLQDAVMNCDEDKINNKSKSLDLESLCIKNWTLFSHRTSIIEMKERYKVIGVDYIFSPFLVLREEFFNKLTKTNRLFVMIIDEYVTLAIFKDGYLSFGLHTNTKNIEEEEEEDAEEDILGLNDLSDLSDLEDLEMNLDDGLENSDDDFDESEQIVDEKDTESNNSDEMIDSDDNSADQNYMNYLLISKELDNYYQNEKYQGEFIEEIYIAFDEKSQDNLKKYLEEELFVDVFVRKTSFSMLLTQIAKKENESDV